MTPKERAREAAKKLVRAYEVGATMKDLDGVAHMWEKIVEKAITAAVAEFEAENARLRNVADAALHYFDVDTGNAEWDSKAFCALDAAVREYRKDLPQNYHNKQDYIDDETGVNLSLPPDATE